MRLTLMFASLLGFTSVGLGAYISHGLRQKISTQQYESLMTALHYQQLHSIVLLVLGVLFIFNVSKYIRYGLRLTSLLFVIGISLFSGSIYLSVIYDLPHLIYLTPIGGMTLLSAWFSLFIVSCFATFSYRQFKY